MSYFNDDQRDYMRHLNSLPRDQLCDCGWAKRGECFGTCYRNADKGGVVIPKEVIEGTRTSYSTIRFR